MITLELPLKGAVVTTIISLAQVVGIVDVDTELLLIITPSFAVPVEVPATAVDAAGDGLGDSTFFC